jgi:serine-type D-Ala-D-Ala carboxypeptidase/endopeptidase
MARLLHVVTAVLLTCSVQASAPWQNELDELAHAYLKSRTNCALVIGVAGAGESDIRGFGQVDGGKTPDANTIFEIGSITKVFTAIVLQQLTQEGLLKLDDRADKYLPNQMKLPQREGRAITLLDLATHSSGLRRLPDNFRIQDNPYAKYGTREFYECLKHTALERKPGDDYAYSNLGYGLLGHILELRTARPYEALVREKLLLPLGMPGTTITLSAEQRARMARGHDRKGQPTANWDFGVLAPAGAFRSTASDLMKFLVANLNPERTRLAATLRGAQTTHFRGKTARVGLGWHKLDTKEGLKLIWHNGGTGGYVSFLGLAPKEQIGVLVLSNYGDALANDWSSDRLALDVLSLLARRAAK